MDILMKTSISDKFLSIPPNLTQEQFSNQSYQILNEFGINPTDFSFSMTEFLNNEWNLYESSGNLDLSGVETLLALIETTVLCKQNLFLYFNFLNNQVKNYDQSCFASNIINYADELLSTIKYFNTKDIKSILYKHSKIIFEDNFTIISCYQALAEHCLLVEKFDPDHNFYLTSCLDCIIENFEKIFDASIEQEKKILMRSFLLIDLRQTDVSFLKFPTIIDQIDVCPPKKIPKKDLELFWQIAHSRVISEAVERFIDDTLTKENPPFQTIEEGAQMVNYAFDWIFTSEKVFYFTIENSHGFSNEGFIFVNRNYQMKSPHAIAFRVLTLFHENFHIYKRISPRPFLNISPVNSFVIPGEANKRAEDGSRFNNLIIPITEIGIYSGSALFLITLSSWSMSLVEFQEQFLMKQFKARSKNEEIYKFWSGACASSIPYSCGRTLLRKNLSPDSPLYWI